jgi:AcrR family transcriptional regulator
MASKNTALIVQRQKNGLKSTSGEIMQEKGYKARTSKASIVMAARNCFAAKGLFDTRMDEIQHLANVSRGALYYHFKSKDEIIKTVIEENLGAFAGRVEAIISLSNDKDLSFPDILIELTSFAEQITFGPGRGMAFHVWSYAMLNEEVREIMVAFFNRICSLLEVQIKASQKKGGLPKTVKPKDAAVALFGLIIPGFTVQRCFLGGQSICAETYIKTVFEELKFRASL